MRLGVTLDVAPVVARFLGCGIGVWPSVTGNTFRSSSAVWLYDCGGGKIRVNSVGKIGNGGFGGWNERVGSGETTPPARAFSAGLLEKKFSFGSFSAAATVSSVPHRNGVDCAMQCLREVDDRKG